MRHFCLFLPIASTGCLEFRSANSTTHAVQFNGNGSCIEAESDGSVLDDPSAGFTIEAWVQGDPDADYDTHPLVIWNGGFALWSGPEGEGHFTDASNDTIGADGSSGWMDGELHHVAGTYQNGTATLFVDGQIIAFNTASTLWSEPTGSIHIGCWASVDVHHHGLIDEVRLSSTVRYSEPFTPAQKPFVNDTETVHLWHFDEGADQVSLDEARLADAYLTDVGWVEFSLSADDTAGR